MNATAHRPAAVTWSRAREIAYGAVEPLTPRWVTLSDAIGARLLDEEPRGR